MEGLPYEKRFHFEDGTVVKNIEELREKIETISYEEFYTHVNQEKNDFANWVEHVLEEKKLAEQLKAVSSIVETVEILNDTAHPPTAEKEGMDLEDIQSRIEQQLFEEPKSSEELPDLPSMNEEPAIPVPEPVEKPVAEEEISLPTKEEIDKNIQPGEAVTSNDAPHIPITKMVSPPTDKHHLRYMLKQFLFGLIMGIIIGLIIGRVIGWF